MVAHPQHLSYTGNHLWVKITDGTATVGLTDDFQHQVSQVESVDLPIVDDELEMDVECMVLHLPTELYHLNSPLTGRVLEVNRQLLDSPEKMFLSPYDEGWLFEMEYDEPDEVEMLMSSEDYEDFLEEHEE